MSSKNKLQRYDVVIIGAGIIGLTIARELVDQGTDNICILDKESSLGRHASGRNSGVLHAGVYYTPDSYKAKFCLEGNELMKTFCRQHNLPLHESGKVIVTDSEANLETLYELKRRAEGCGADVKLVTAEELRKIEPHAFTHKTALHVRTTALVDSRSILRALHQELLSSGKVEFRLSEEFRGVQDSNTIKTSHFDIRFGKLINAAGAFADKVAHSFGVGKEYSILPFKGTYLKLKNEKAGLVNGNIYPVPDLQNPFLGVHLTKNVHGDVYVGPTAIPALGRENYWGLVGLGSESLSICLRDISMYVGNRDFRRAANMAAKRVTRRAIYKDAVKLVPALEKSDLKKSSKVGIRPQLVHRPSQQLVMDFKILYDEVSIHVLNAISPAFTSSMAFAKHVVSMLTSNKTQSQIVMSGG